MKLKAVSLVLLGFLVIVIPVLCQTTAEKRPSFEVATIKPSDPGQRESRIGNMPGGRLVVRGVPVMAMMTFAYVVRNFQITGGPGWISTDRWDIEARAEEGSVGPPVIPPDPNKPNPMAVRLQSLLEDRFQLKLH